MLKNYSLRGEKNVFIPLPSGRGLLPPPSLGRGVYSFIPLSWERGLLSSLSRVGEGWGEVSLLCEILRFAQNDRKKRA